MESAERIAKGMLMMEPGESVKDGEVRDAFGEMVNMIIGGVKTRLSDTVGELKISIPSTITGEPLEPMLSKAAEIVDLTTRVEDNMLKFVMQYSSKS
jgi:CheY-specific phosphatase CheX